MTDQELTEGKRLLLTGSDEESRPRREWLWNNRYALLAAAGENARLRAEVETIKRLNNEWEQGDLAVAAVSLKMANESLVEENAALRAELAELKQRFELTPDDIAAMESMPNDLVDRLWREAENESKYLEESVKLQSHYARLLNQYDGGERMLFANADEWKKRVDEVVQSSTPPDPDAELRDPEFLTTRDIEVLRRIESRQSTPPATEEKVVKKYDDPTEPVGVDDWEALKDESATEETDG